MSNRIQLRSVTAFLLACAIVAPPMSAQRRAPNADEAGPAVMNRTGLAVGNLILGPTDGILRYSGGGRFLDAVVPSGTAGLAGPCCVVFGPDDNMYVSNLLGGGGVLRFNGLTGAFIDEFVPVPRPPALPEFPLTLVFHEAYVYVGYPFAQEIRQYDAATGAFVDTFVQNGDFDGDGSVDMTFGDPQHFAFGPDGHLYVAAEYSNRILKFDGQTGAFLQQVLGPLDGFTRPSGLVFGPDGWMYVGSVDMNEIRRFDIATGFSEVFVQTRSGGLDTPVGIAFGPDGHLYATSVGASAILGYDGRTGEFRGALVPSGHGGLTAPRTLSFNETVTLCHVPPAGQRDRNATMTMSYVAALGHATHGDTPGACR